jgi:hypothetical protein
LIPNTLLSLDTVAHRPGPAAALAIRDNALDLAPQTVDSLDPHPARRQPPRRNCREPPGNTVRMTIRDKTGARLCAPEFEQTPAI